MSLLVQSFRKEVSKSKDLRMKNEGQFGVGYSTGFLGLDFLNGTVVHVKGKDKQFSYNSVGILDGCATMVIGRSGCGKSTLLLQAAANIVRPFKTSAIFHDDIEGGMSDSRKEILTLFSQEELNNKYVYRNTGITAENFYQRIRMLHDMKIETPEAYMYDTGVYDNNGNRIAKFEPTVYILDSIPLLVPDKISEEEEVSGQMSAASTAKLNTKIFKQIIPLLKTANIMLLSVNHILDDIQIGLFPNKPQLSFLKSGERLPGGKAALYLANNLFRLDDSAKLKAEKEFGIDGVIVNVTTIKSRTNRSGRSIPLVFEYETGFDATLSLYVLLKENGRVNGSSAYLYLGDNSHIKFSQKKFKEILQENTELQDIFAKECFDVLQTYLSNPSTEDRHTMIDMSSKIFELANAGMAA